FPFIIILPGMLAIAFDPTLTKLLHGRYDNALPALLGKFYPPGLLGLGLTALLASFMSGMAGNVTAFNTVWTYDIYQTHICPNRSDRHYLMVGRAATVFAVAAGIGTAFIVLRFNNLMDYLQLLFSFFSAPLFATFLLGMFWKRTTSHGAFWGLLAGISGAGLHHGLEDAGVFHYRSAMAADFHLAIFSWSVCFAVTIVVTLFTKPKKEVELVGLVYQLTPVQRHRHLPWYQRPGAWAIALLGATAALNIIFW
ncbi:MAG: sodium:solute symporter family transporter, partial [Terriglobia bacterium]